MKTARWVKHCTLYTFTVVAMLILYIIVTNRHAGFIDSMKFLGFMIIPVWIFAIVKRAIYGRVS